MNPYYVPDYMLDPPEDNRDVMSRCLDCDEAILEYDEIIHSEYLDGDFCEMDCLKSYLGVRSKYYEKY